MSHRRFPALTLIAAGVLALTTVCIPAATAAGSGAAATTGALQPSTVLAPTIEVPTTRLDISPTSTALSLGQSLTFDAAYDSGPVYPGDVEWASSNDSVLTVDQEGRVSAVGLGEATITVTDKNDASLTSTSTVKVREVSEEAGIELSASDVSAVVNHSVFLNALLSPSLQGSSVTWNVTPSSLGSINARDDASAAEFWASQQAGTGTLTATVTNAAGAAKTVTVPVSVQPDPRGDFVTNDDGVLVEYRGTDPNIRIPEGVTGIGSSFSSIALDSVWVPASVRTIDDRAFYGTGLKEITFQDDDEHPSQLTAIYGEAFSMTAIETLTLPRSVETVLQSFENMGNLTTVRLGPNLGPDQLVGDFRYTPKLTNIEVDPASANYTSDDGVLYTKDHSHLIAYPSAKNAAGNYRIPEGTSAIDDNAFENAQVSTVTMPTTLRTIGAQAFAHSGLTQLTLPDGLRSAGTWAFAYTTNLTSVDLGGITALPDGAFIGSSSLTDVNFRPDLAALTTIGEDAFDWTSLTTATLPDTVTTIADNAFANNTALTSLHLGAGVTSIGATALGGTPSLASLSVSPANASYYVTDGVLYEHAPAGPRLVRYPPARPGSEFEVAAGTTWIGTWAFDGASSLTRVVLPEGLTTIDYGAFYGCTSLTDMAIPESVDTARGVVNTGLDTVEFGSKMREISMTAREYRMAPHLIVRGGVDGEYYTDGEASNGRPESAFFGEGMTTVAIRSKGPKVVVLPSTLTQFELDPFSAKGFKSDTQVYVAAAEGSPAWNVAKAELEKEGIDLSHLHAYVPATITLSGSGIDQADEGYAWTGTPGTALTLTATVSGAVPDGRELRVTQVDADGTETLIQDWSAMEQEGEASSLNVSWTPNASGAHLRVETRDITRVVRSTSLSVTAAPAPQPTAGTWQWGARGWWYRYADGTYPASETLVIGGQVYRFDAAGYMRTGWVREDGTWYYHAVSGAQASGWVLDGVSWYYLTPGTGAMATGWLKDGASWYYLNPASGAMVTGWLKDGDSWYYLRPGSGAMVTGRVWIGWRWYTFADNGQWIR